MNILLSFFSRKPNETTTVTTTEKVAEKPKLTVPEDSMLKRHFLTQLQADIENSLVPSFTDPSLKHYYEASVVAEYQKRLANVFK